MSSSSVSTFQDPDGYLTALKEAGYRHLLLLEPSPFRARMTSIQLDHMWLSYGEEWLARIAFLDLPPATTRVLLPVPHGTVACGGIAVGKADIMTHGAGLGVHERVTTPVTWRHILISSQHLSDVGRVLAGAPPIVPTVARLWRPSTGLVRELVTLHTAATRLTERRPRELHTAHASHGLEKQLINLLVECLSSPPFDEVKAAGKNRRVEIVARFEQTITAHCERIPTLQVICEELGIDEHTLRRYCRTQLGLGPARYLSLRRMQLVHKTLGNFTSRLMTVEQVARQHGFTQMGRFATSYRKLYGESPSATMRRGHGSPLSH